MDIKCVLGGRRCFSLMVLAILLPPVAASCSAYNAIHLGKSSHAEEGNLNEVRAHYLRGISFCGEGEHDKAIDEFNEAIRLDSKYARAYCGRGDCYRKKHDLEHAIADYTEAIRLDQADAQAFQNRGDCYGEMGQNEKAKDDHIRAMGLRIPPGPGLQKTQELSRKLNGK